MKHEDKLPKKPKPSTGHVYCEGCGHHPDDCRCGSFRVMLVMFLVLAAVSWLSLIILIGYKAWRGQ